MKKRSTGRFKAQYNTDEMALNVPKSPSKKGSKRGGSGGSESPGKREKGRKTASEVPEGELQDPTKSPRKKHKRASSDIAITRRQIVRENRQSFLSVYEVPSGPGAMLGEGAFGTVVKCKHRITGIGRAAKKIPKNALDDQKLFENEVENLMKLDHPHIVKLVEYFEEEEM